MEVFEDLESTLEVHDKFHFEVRLDFAFKKSEAKKYIVDSYLFFPSNVLNDPSSYSKDSFYEDLQNYIRFKTPSFGLEVIADIKNPASPLRLLTDSVKNVISGNAEESVVEECHNRIRNFGCVTRSSMRDYAGFIRECVEKKAKCEKGEKAGKADESAGNLLDKFLALTDVLFAGLRDLIDLSQTPTFPPALREKLLFLKEFLSMELELTASRLLRVFRKLKASPAVSDCMKRLGAVQDAEQAYRFKMGLSPAAKTILYGEVFAYHHSVLKKYFYGILFLDISRRIEGFWRENLLHSLAAGLSMAFAATAMYIIAVTYKTLSFPMVALMAFAYMVKDRLKELFRRAFSERLHSRIYDYRVKIVDPVTRKAIGLCKELVNYADEDNLGPRVMALRDKNSYSRLEAAKSKEMVLHYRKLIVLHPAPAMKIRGDITGLKDITRFNFFKFANMTSDPKIEYFTLSSNDKIALSKIMRIYHVNIIFRFRSLDDNDERYLKVRVVFNRLGIKNIEVVN